MVLNTPAVGSRQGAVEMDRPYGGGRCELSGGRCAWPGCQRQLRPWAGAGKATRSAVASSWRVNVAYLGDLLGRERQCGRTRRGFREPAALR